MPDLPPTDPDPARRLLGLEAAVLDSFRFLESDFGFRIVSSEPTLVRYESDAVVVNVYHGRGSYELGVEIGLRRSQRRFSLQRIAALTEGDIDIHDRTAWEFTTADPQILKRFVNELAVNTKRVGRSALTGDPDTYAALEEASTLRALTYSEGTQAVPIRRAADEAWAAKDLAAVVAAYEQLSKLKTVQFTRGEKKRLKYARKWS